MVEAGDVAVRVLFVDDHRVFVDAVSAVLEAAGDIEVVRRATTMAEAEALAASVRPDVVIVDVDLGREDGLLLTQRLRAEHPEIRVVVLTCHEDAATACAAVRAGASAFVPKVAAVQDLVQAIRGVQRGESWIPPSLLTAVLRALQAPAREKSPEEQAIALLSAREQEVLALLAAGCDRATIARRLFVSQNTVRTHVQKVLAKLGVHSSLEAVGIALRAGLRGQPGADPHATHTRA